MFKYNKINELITRYKLRKEYIDNKYGKQIGDLQFLQITFIHMAIKLLVKAENYAWINIISGKMIAGLSIEEFIMYLDELYNLNIFKNKKANLEFVTFSNMYCTIYLNVITKINKDAIDFTIENK